ncbi:hypothetical protein [Pectinatus haikarae]|uniref:Uncharacterized protein n=1 Tax=Pectinatus haikarae TaxID=349096 RepID=A0ABT9YDI3_9FIRM|nr:hypothetical protein [Pectinatus haikarae]MDQ0205094.1 hypothetical protein [Pectinatus haikarae]
MITILTAIVWEHAVKDIDLGGGSPGADYLEEKYDKINLERTNLLTGNAVNSEYETFDASRNNYSVYGQWEPCLNNADTKSNLFE